jgi:hypothetical protein
MLSRRSYLRLLAGKPCVSCVACSTFCCPLAGRLHDVGRHWPAPSDVCAAVLLAGSSTIDESGRDADVAVSLSRAPSCVGAAHSLARRMIVGVCLSQFDVASDVGRSAPYYVCAVFLCVRAPVPCMCVRAVRARTRAHTTCPHHSVVSYIDAGSIGTAAAIASLIGLNMSFQVAAPAYPAMCLYRFGRTYSDRSLYRTVYTYIDIST